MTNGGYTPPPAFGTKMRRGRCDGFGAGFQGFGTPPPVFFQFGTILRRGPCDGPRALLQGTAPFSPQSGVYRVYVYGTVKFFGIRGVV